MVTLEQAPPKSQGETLEQALPKCQGETLEKAPPKSHGETLEKAPPESHKGTLEEAPPDPIIDHDMNSPLLIEPTTDVSREPLRKAFSESPTTSGAPYDEPCQSTYLQQNTEHLDDSLQ